MKTACLLLPACALLLAACSGFNGGRQMAAADVSSVPALGDEAQASVGSTANEVAPKDLPTSQGPTASRAREGRPRPGADHRPSSFVQQSPHLFSDKQLERPWPKTGTQEWKEQQEKDARRERELQQSIKICADC
jgi:hypothetical protein